MSRGHPPAHRYRLSEATRTCSTLSTNIGGGAATASTSTSSPISPISAPKGSLIIWDGRVWHGTGINKTGAPRRSVGVFFALPWLRQQENWGVTTLQEVLDEASDKLKVRLGLKSYGTLGMMEGGNGTQSGNFTLGNSMLQIPEFVIGEDGKKHPMKRVSREQTL